MIAGMKTKTAIKHFGGVTKLVDALEGITTRQAIYAWGKYPPIGRQYQIESITGGVLKAEVPKKRKANRLESHEEHKCPACGGNDGDMPCAYPGEHERQPGCLRAFRLSPNTD